MNLNELVLKYKDLYEIQESVSVGLSGNEYITASLAFVPSNLARVLQNDYSQFTRFCQQENMSERVSQYFEAQQKHLSVDISFLKFLEARGELQKEQIRVFKETIFALLEQKRVTFNAVEETQTLPQPEKEKQKRNWFKSKKQAKQSSLANDPNSAQYLLNQFDRLEQSKKEFDDTAKHFEEELKKLK